MKKPYINIHPNAVVVRSYNKETVVADHKNEVYIRLTKKYDRAGIGPAQFVELPRNVGRIELLISKESMEEIISAYRRLLKRLESERVASNL